MVGCLHVATGFSIYLGRVLQVERPGLHLCAPSRDARGASFNTIVINGFQNRLEHEQSSCQTLLLKALQMRAQVRLENQGRVAAASSGGEAGLT